MKKNKIFQRGFYYVEAQSMFLSLCKTKWICETRINCKHDQKSQQSTAIEHCLVLQERAPVAAACTKLQAVQFAENGLYINGRKVLLLYSTSGSSEVQYLIPHYMSSFN